MDRALLERMIAEDDLGLLTIKVSRKIERDRYLYDYLRMNDETIETLDHLYLDCDYSLEEIVQAAFVVGDEQDKEEAK